MRADRSCDDGAGVAVEDVLGDRNRGAEPIDLADRRGPHAFGGSERKRLEETPIGLVIEGIEGERRLARPGDANDGGDPGAEGHIDLAKVVLVGPLDDDLAFTHRWPRSRIPGWSLA